METQLEFLRQHWIDGFARQTKADTGLPMHRRANRVVEIIAMAIQVDDLFELNIFIAVSGTLRISVVVVFFLTKGFDDIIIMQYFIYLFVLGVVIFLW